MIKKLTVYITGMVQRVGYRSRIINMAWALDLKGFTNYTKDGRVKIIAEGE